MRRHVFVLIGSIVAAGLLVTPAAFAAPTPGPSGSAGPVIPAPVKGTQVCKITDTSDPRLQELSGLASFGDGYAAIADGPDDGAREILRRVTVFFFDGACKLTSKFQGTQGQDIFDTEDVAVAKDGTIWIADTGDNNAFTATGTTRKTVALWKVTGEGTKRKAQLYRLAYPDGAKDAEALLLNGDGTPIIVTKSLTESGIYVPEAPLAEGPNGVPLKKVGTFTATKTGTPGGPVPAMLGQMMVTGGANSPDGTKAVLRTYTDAYEWDVANGDVIGALTKNKPRITPLPDEPQGEAIAYSKDGTAFLTVSETSGDSVTDKKPSILKYTPAVPPPPAKNNPAGTAAKSGDAPDSLTLGEIAMMVGAVGVLGLIMVIAGVVGIRKSRTARAKEARVRKATGRARPDGGPDGPGPGGPGGGPGIPPPPGPIHPGGGSPAAPEVPKAPAAKGAVYGRPPVPANDDTSAIPRVPAEPDPLAFLDEPKPARGVRARAAGRPTAPGIVQPAAGPPRPSASAGRARPAAAAAPVPPPPAPAPVPDRPVKAAAKPKARKARPVEDDMSFGFDDLRAGDNDPDLGLRSPKKK
ncbi:hypothetical protein [Longispora albida]|uniref:hypothetical protein n=1 Tax=Longispora albida TaxID=203523 RepID=UPI0003A6826A|nr:hypothetical protein [Longispora albida]